MKRLGLALFVLACASSPPAPPRASLLGPAVDIEALLPPAPPPIVVPAHVQQFEDMRVRTGQCPGLPPGMLVDDATHAKLYRAVQERQALRTEVGVLHQLRKQERTICNDLLEAQRVLLIQKDKEAQSTRRWAAIKLAAGIGLGVVAGFAVGRLTR